MTLTTPPPSSSRFCWICGKEVFSENSKMEEHGNIVHETCDEARLKLNKAALQLKLGPTDSLETQSDG
jgi:hypothetical protein